MIIQTTSPAHGIVYVNNADEKSIIKTDCLVLLSQGEGTALYGDSTNPMVITPNEGENTNVIFREKAVEENGNTTYTGDFNGQAYVTAKGSVLFKDSVIKGQLPKSENEKAQGVVKFTVINGNVGFSNIQLKEFADFDVIVNNEKMYQLTVNNMTLQNSANLNIQADRLESKITDLIVQDNADMVLSVERGNAVFNKITVTGTQEPDSEKATLDVHMQDGSISVGTSQAEFNPGDVHVSGKATLNLQAKGTNGSVTAGNVTGNGNAEIIITNDADVILKDVTLNNAASMNVTNNGNVSMNDVDLNDTSKMAIQTTDGNIRFANADVENAEVGKYAELNITTIDTNADNDPSTVTGNVTIGSVLNAQGKVVLNLSGSLLAENQPKEADESTSTLVLGKDTYTNGTSFSIGKDMGSKEIPLTVDVRIPNSSETVTFRIETVGDVFIRGAEHYELTDPNPTYPNGKPADGEQEVIVNVTPEEIAKTISDALKAYEEVLNSEDSTQEEKTAADEALKKALTDLAELLEKVHPDDNWNSDNFRVYLEDMLRDSGIGEEETQKQLSLYDAVVEMLYQREIMEEVLNTDPEHKVSVDITDSDDFEAKKAEAIEKLSEAKELLEEGNKALDPEEDEVHYYGINGLKTVIDALTEQIAAWKADMEQLSRLHEDYDAVKEQLDALNSDESADVSLKESLEQQLANLGLEIAALKEKLGEDPQSTLTQLGADLGSYRVSLKGLLQEEIVLDTKLQILLGGKLEQLKNEYEEHLKAVEDAEKALDDAETELEEVQADKKSAESVLNSAESDEAKAKQNLDDAEKALEETKEDADPEAYETLEKAYEDALSDYEKAKSALDTAQQAYDKAQESYDEALAKLQLAQEAKDNADIALGIATAMEAIFRVKDLEKADLAFLLGSILSSDAREALLVDQITDIFADIPSNEQGNNTDTETAQQLRSGYLALFNEMMTEEHKQEILDDLQKQADEKSPNEYRPEEPVDMYVVIDQSTGNSNGGGVNISNYGDITVTVNQGDLYVGVIETNRSDLTPGEIALSDVTLTTNAGSIIGLTQQLNGQNLANITANDIKLEASDSILNLMVNEIARDYEITNELLDRENGEILTNPEVKYELVEDEVPVLDENGNQLTDEDGNLVTKTVWRVVLKSSAYVDYTGNHVFDETEATSINASAVNGSIEIDEVSGDMGLGVISAPNGTVSLSAGILRDEEGNAIVDENGRLILGNVLDKRTDEQQAAGSANITAGAVPAGGNVPQSNLSGDLIGTSQLPIVVDIKGKLFADANGDIYLDGKGSLNAQTDSQSGKVYAKAENDLTLSSSPSAYGGSGDLYVVKPEAGRDITLNAAGTLYTDIVDASGSNNEPGSATLIAGKDIYADKITAGKDVTVDAGTDIHVNDIIAGRHASVNADGDIFVDDVNAGGNAVVIAGNDIVTDSINAGGDASVAAGNNVVSDVISAGGNASVAAGNNVVSDIISAGGNASVTGGINVTAGMITAGGNASVEATKGSILEGERGDAPAAVTGKNISLIAGQTIGTKADPYEVDTAEDGTLSVIAGTASIREISGNVKLTNVNTTGDFILDVPDGSVLDGNDSKQDDAADAKDALDSAKDKVDELNTDIRVYEELIIPPLEEIRKNAEEVERLAEEALKSAEAEVADLQKNLDVLEKKAEAQQETLKKAVDAAQAQLEQELAITKSEIASAEAALEALIKRQDDGESGLEEQISELQDTLKVLGQREETIKTQLEKLSDADQSSQAVLDRIAQINQSLADKQSEIDAVEKELEAVDQEISDKNSQKEILEKEKADLERQLSELDESDPDDSEKITALKQQIKDIEEEIDRLDLELGSLNTQRNDVSTQQNELQKALDAAKETAENLLKDLTPAKDLLESGAIEELQQQIEDTQKDLQTAENHRDNAQDAYDKANLDAETARENLQKAKDALEALKEELKKANNAVSDAQKAYDEAEANTEASAPTVTTGGDVNIDAQGSVGENGNSLSVDADGKVNVTAGEDIVLSAPDHITLDRINSGNGTGNVTIHAGGDIKDVSGTKPAITAKRADLTSTGGDIGDAENPLSLHVDEVKANAENIFIENDKDLIVDSIHSEGKILLNIDGDVSRKDKDTIISGKHLEAEVNGDFGMSPEERINTNLGGISLNAKNININNISNKLVVDKLEGESIDVTAKGDIIGQGVKAENLVMNSNGYTGYADGPLLVEVSGKLDITSNYGEVHYINRYRKPIPEEKPEEKPKEEPKQEENLPDQEPEIPEEEPQPEEPKVPEKPTPESGRYAGFGTGWGTNTGDDSPIEMYLYLMMLSAAAFLLLLKKKRRTVQ